MTSELTALIILHFACANISAERPLSAQALSAQEFHTCSAIYQEIKLAFVPDVDTQRYIQMTAEDRARVNREGFQQFYQWRQDNPATVNHLERVARGEARLGDAT